MRFPCCLFRNRTVILTQKPLELRDLEDNSKEATLIWADALGKQSFHDCSPRVGFASAVTRPASRISNTPPKSLCISELKGEKRRLPGRTVVQDTVSPEGTVRRHIVVCMTTVVTRHRNGSGHGREPQSAIDLQDVSVSSGIAGPRPLD